MKKLVVLASLVVMFFISCNDDNSGVSSTFSIQQKKLLKKSNETNKTVSSFLAGTFSFTKAIVGVSKVELKMESEMHDDESEEEIEYEGAYQFDVLTGASLPPLQPVEMQPGLYTELEFEIDPILSSGNSIEIFGTHNDGVNDYSFEFTSTINEEYEVENINGIDLNMNENTSFVLFLELESLFDGVDFGNAIVDADNIIRINSESNSEMARLIEDNLENIMDFEDDDHEDADHDKS